jgi:hypothetical protein
MADPPKDMLEAPQFGGHGHPRSVVDSLESAGALGGGKQLAFAR